MALDTKNYHPSVMAGAIIDTAYNQPTVAGGALALNIGSATAPAIYFGSGAPTITATQGSLYLRSDGNSVATRLYLNTTGSTTWTNVTTAA